MTEDGKVFIDICNLLTINDKLKNRLKADLSMQSLNLDTLKTVKRTNWTAAQYIEFTRDPPSLTLSLKSLSCVCVVIVTSPDDCVNAKTTPEAPALKTQ